MQKGSILKSGYIYFLILSILLIIIFYFVIPIFSSSSFIVSQILPEQKNPAKPIITHIKTPSQVRAIYMTACAASSLTFREKLVAIATSTEINSIVIDVKDYTGTISFDSENPLLKGNTGEGCKVSDLKDFVKELHEKGIYVIGRISSFQDSHLVKVRPELAVKRASDGSVWKDYKGVSWLDSGSKEVWDYLIAIGRESYAIGFDELNFDYIRFPSDGNMKDIAYPFSKNLSKQTVMKNFYKYLRDNLNDLGVPLSADMFGMVTTTNFDLNIGQVLDDALLYFDYISPMVYPSHYPDTWNGFANPADHPYDVIKLSMEGAILKVNNLKANLATSTPSEIRNRISIKQLRPWLQDFNLGATYTSAMVKAEIQAVYDIGLDSWLLWNASNVYTKSALLSE
ncbi:MAG: putative glycoside hydrolase [Minisyncoccia bacterium]